MIDVNKNIIENEKCYYYKKYEKEIDFYNGDIIPNFLEISIKLYFICFLLKIRGFSNDIKENTNPKNAKWNIIFVLGSPGDGKSTQCDKIKNKYKIYHYFIFNMS